MPFSARKIKTRRGLGAGLGALYNFIDGPPYANARHCLQSHHYARLYFGDVVIEFASAAKTCDISIMSKNPVASPLAVTTGRWLLALYFLVPGIMKFLAFPMHVGLMTLHKVPFPAQLLVIAGSAQIIGALLLMANRFVRFTALGFVIYIILINLLLHDFWNFTGIVAGHELQNFIKNLGILAGLLVLAGYAPWRFPTLKGLATSDR
jgi:putative oxidoreductase